jgi:hypothetical protein
MMEGRRASQNDRNGVASGMAVRQHHGHYPLFPGTANEMLDLRLPAVEPVLAAVVVFQHEPLEIAEAIENERSHFAGDVRLLVEFLLLLVAQEFAGAAFQ